MNTQEILNEKYKNNDDIITNINNCYQEAMKSNLDLLVYDNSVNTSIEQIIINVENNYKLQKYLNSNNKGYDFFDFGEEVFENKKEITLPLVADHKNLLSNIKLFRSFNHEIPNVDILLKPNKELVVLASHFFKTDQMRLYYFFEDQIRNEYDHSDTYFKGTNNKTLSNELLEKNGLIRTNSSIITIKEKEEQHAKRK